MLFLFWNEQISIFNVYLLFSPLLFHNIFHSLTSIFLFTFTWIKNCYNREDFYHWIIDYNKISIGYISLSNYSLNNDEVSFGVFIGEEDYLNFGAIAMFYFYNFVIHYLNLYKIDI